MSARTMPMTGKDMQFLIEAIAWSDARARRRRAQYLRERADHDPGDEDRAR